jgi:uncharacterized membrane protein YGL010W
MILDLLQRCAHLAVVVMRNYIALYIVASMSVRLPSSTIGIVIRGWIEQ